MHLSFPNARRPTLRVFEQTLPGTAIVAAMTWTDAVDACCRETPAVLVVPPADYMESSTTLEAPRQPSSVMHCYQLSLLVRALAFRCVCLFPSLLFTDCLLQPFVAAFSHHRRRPPT